MRIGVTFPQREGGLGADIGAIREYVQAAESLGYNHIRSGDHVLGANASSRPGWTGPYDHTDLWHEPLVLFSYLASLTNTLEFVPSILILPTRQTALVAKQAAELDYLSGGRLRLGIGVGWNDVEFEALGDNFRNRGRRSEEQIEVLRALWSQELVTFDGRWHKISDAGLNPMPVQRPIPLWIGGGPGSVRNTATVESDRVLKRIAKMADGWFPLLGLRDDVQSVIGRLHEYTRQEGRDPSDVGVEGSVSLGSGTPEEWAEQARAWNEAGADYISANPAGAGMATLKEHIDALRRFMEAVVDVVD